MSSGDVRRCFFFLRKGNSILPTVELQLSVSLNHNTSTLLTFGVKINTFSRKVSGKNQLFWQHISEM